MRMFAVCLAILMAGCTTPGDVGGPADPSSDGQDDGPGQSPGSGTDPGDGQPHNGSDTADPPSDDPASGPPADATSGENATSELRFEVFAWRCDAGWCLNGTATNIGDTTYHISDVCTPPFHERMYRDSQAVTPREPGGTCAAFGTRPFPPGDETWLEYTWDERVYDHGQHEMVAAPPGDYAWGALFVAYAGTHGEGPVRLEATALVRVD